MKSFVISLAAVLCLSLSANAQIKPSIVGGINAQQGEFSFIVSLQSDLLRAKTKQGHFCGGSLIAPDWVLTAAHCVQGEDKVFVDSVWIGMYDQRSQVGLEKITPDKIIFHPQFSMQTMDYDYALIHLSQNSSYKAIALNTNELVYNSRSPIMFTTLGWGLTSEFAMVLPNILQKVSVPFVSKADCTAKSAYGSDITDRMLCAGYKAGKMDACSGDSGGPLVYNQPNGTPVLAGIVSWGIGCARKNKYGVYEKVNQGLSWIKATSGLTF